MSLVLSSVSCHPAENPCKILIIIEFLWSVDIEYLRVVKCVVKILGVVSYVVEMLQLNNELLMFIFVVMKMTVYVF